MRLSSVLERSARLTKAAISAILLIIIAASVLRPNSAFVIAWLVILAATLGAYLGVRFGPGVVRRWTRESRSEHIATRQGLSHILINLGICAVFLLVVFAQKSYDAAWADFGARGAVTAAYGMGRIALVPFFVLFSVCVGQLVLAPWSAGSPRGLDQMAIEFFAGMAMASVIAVCLGLLGILSLELVLALTLTLFLFRAHGGLTRICNSLRSAQDKKTASGDTESILVTTLSIITAALVIFLLVAKVGVPITSDGDVWVHYLHYYRRVIGDGSVGPNELWYHFYLSKGAGQQFIAMLWSDFLGAPIASGAALLMATLVAAGIERGKMGAQWALLSAIIMLAYLNSDTTGMYFKHHAVTAGYVTFLLWVSYMVLSGFGHKSMLVAGGMACFALGVYQPIPAGVLLLLLGFWASVIFVLGRREAAAKFSPMLLTLGGSIALTLGINYWLTGLPEMVPVRWMHAVADRNKVQSVLGNAGMYFFEVVYSDIVTRDFWSAEWLKSVFRWGYFKILFGAYLAAGFVLVSLLFKFPRAGTPMPADIRLGLFAFVSVLLMVPLALFLQVSSMQRMLVFAGILLAISGTVFARIVVDQWVPPRIRSATRVVIPLLLAVYAFARSVQGLEALGFAPFQYVAGLRSYEEVISQIDRANPSGAPNIKQMAEIRDRLGPSARIYALTYSPTFSFAVPGEGLVSEPSYPLKRLYRDLDRSMSFSRWESALRNEGLEYFVIDLRSLPFSPLFFSDLLSPSRLKDHFNVVYRNGTVVVLKFGQQMSPRTMPESLGMLIDLRRSNVIYRFFSDRFYDDAAIVVGELVPKNPRADCATIELSGRKVQERLQGLVDHELAGLEMAASRTLLDAIFQRIFAGLEKEAGNCGVSTPASEPQNGSSANSAYLGRFRESIRSELLQALSAYFGPDVAARLVEHDNWWPYKAVYDRLTAR